jgi:AraC-like DNA-binding protein
MRPTGLTSLQRSPPLRPDYGTSADRPVTVLHDLWPRVGPGQCDMHYALELGIVLRGRMRRDHCGWRGTFAAGDLWLSGIWEPHAAFVRESPLELAVLHIHPPFLARLAFPELPALRPLSLFTAPPGRRPHPLSAHRPVWRTFGQRVVALAEDDSAVQPLRLHALLLELLAEIVERSGWLSEGGTSSAEGYEDISRAIERVFGTDGYVRTTEAARVAGMNRNLFSRRFRDLMGVSFHDFALRHRLGLAAQLLRESDLPVKAIADRLGFTDKSHLHRHFVDLYGQTPLRYRNGDIGGDATPR